MYRGLLAIITFFIAFFTWIAIIVYPRIKVDHLISCAKERHLVARASIISIFIIVSMSTFRMQHNGSFFLMLIPLIPMGLFCVEIRFLFIPKLHSFVPLIVGAATIVVIPPIAKYCQIAYNMWESKVNAGSAGYSELSLAGMHSLFILMCIILNIILFARIIRCYSDSQWISLAGSIIFIICINVSFFYTEPRKGSEGVILWIFLTPAFMIVDLVLITTIVIFAISLIVKQKKQYRLYERKKLTG